MIYVWSDIFGGKLYQQITLASNWYELKTNSDVLSLLKFVVYLLQRNMMDLIYKQEFYEIKSACIEIRNILGTGFLEKVYENALKIELEERGFEIMQQYSIKVIYKNKIVGDYIADLFIVKNT